MADGGKGCGFAVGRQGMDRVSLYVSLKVRIKKSPPQNDWGSGGRDGN